MNSSPSLPGATGLWSGCLWGALRRRSCPPPGQVWRVFPPLGGGAREAGEGMTSAASAPVPASRNLNAFRGVSRALARTRLTSKCLQPLSCLLSPLTLEGRLGGNVAESWGFLRTREAEVLQKAPGRCPMWTVFSELGGGVGAASYSLGDKSPEDRTWRLWWVLGSLFFFSVRGKSTVRLGT